MKKLKIIAICVVICICFFAMAASVYADGWHTADIGYAGVSGATTWTCLTSDDWTGVKWMYSNDPNAYKSILAVLLTAFTNNYQVYLYEVNDVIYNIYLKK